MKTRQAKVSDAAAIEGIIRPYSKDGLMLGRTRESIIKSIQSYTVLEADGKLIGCAALSIFTEEYAELRSLAVDAESKGLGGGVMIVKALIERAGSLDIPYLFALTYVQGFFEKLGFSTIDKEKLPHKIWSDCINCGKFPNCDETALIIKVL